MIMVIALLIKFDFMLYKNLNEAKNQYLIKIGINQS